MTKRSEAEHGISQVKQKRKITSAIVKHHDPLVEYTNSYQLSFTFTIVNGGGMRHVISRYCATGPFTDWSSLPLAAPESRIGKSMTHQFQTRDVTAAQNLPLSFTH